MSKRWMRVGRGSAEIFYSGAEENPPGMESQKRRGKERGRACFGTGILKAGLHPDGGRCSGLRK